MEDSDSDLEEPDFAKAAEEMRKTMDLCPSSPSSSSSDDEDEDEGEGEGEGEGGKEMALPKATKRRRPAPRQQLRKRPQRRGKVPSSPAPQLLFFTTWTELVTERLHFIFDSLI